MPVKVLKEFGTDFFALFDKKLAVLTAALQKNTNSGTPSSCLKPGTPTPFIQATHSYSGVFSFLPRPPSAFGLRPCKARTGWNWCSSVLYWMRLPLGQRGAKQRMDWTSDLIFTFVWDETASGTMRINPENVHSWSASPFIMGWDCLWNSKEQHRGETAQLICSSLHYGTRLPLEQGGAFFLVISC